MTDSKKASSNYRPEIQGIRTIGALLVAAFHIWGGRVSGGVDVFFVISGFLITGSLYREIKRTQTINVIAFWGRIAKRITPMACVILALTLVAALLWMPQSRQQGLLSEVIYSAVHLENIKLMMSSVDYLARDEAPSPVQQFWALSVQVQFYAVWPFLLLGIAIAAKRLRVFTSAYIVGLAALLIVSLGYSITQTNLNPSPTYFNTLARVWEFALGGMLAIALPYLNLPAALRLVAGWVGLAMVVSCGFLVPASAHYPGYVALWPTLGAVLIIVSGGGGVRFGADHILASKPLVALGEISFSFYLWHWPILVFFLIVDGQTQLGLVAGLSVIAIALCGAYATHRWFEQPVQQSSIGRSNPWHVHAMAVGLALPIVAASAVWYKWNDVQERRQSAALEQMMRRYPGGSQPISLAKAIKPGVPLHPTVSEARNAPADFCSQEKGEQGIVTCIHGVIEGYQKTIALVGGSQVEQWLPALEALASAQKWKIVVLAESDCSSCDVWSEAMHDAVLKLHPNVVFTVATSQRMQQSEAREAIPGSYLTQWKKLADNSITAIALRHTPSMGEDVLDCVEVNLHDIAKCAIPRWRLFDEIDPVSKLSPKPRNVRFIDLTDRFCDEQLCLPVGGNVLVYRDARHMTPEYARTLARRLGQRMQQVRPDLFLSNALEELGSDYPGGSMPMAVERAVKPNVPVYPRAAAVKYKHPNFCQQNETEAEVLTCVYGEVKNPFKTIALVGGSHAEHWLPALERLAHEYKWKIVAVTKSACQYSTEVESVPSCTQWNRDVHDVVRRINPDVVFTTSTRRRSRVGGLIEYIPNGYLAHWKRLEGDNISVIAVRDSARTRPDAPDCMEANLRDISKCAVPRSELFDEVDPTSMLSPKPANVNFIDLTDRFCDEKLCLPVGGNVLVFRDTHHITIEYSRTLAMPLGERMKQVRPDLFPAKAQPSSGQQKDPSASQ
ncbi:acyltransferase family protein [Microvirga sp. VF16]|uniref:acyltransferase family protein n=1 Tax=Microvirga sp. VF16 TaxID=2807101 RepID=UPI00193E42AD|nr:acyltransferase family protein [Microvirga sp. VF16]QRM28457.1 acyltransferase [Microvirga sp. VF16]